MIIKIPEEVETALNILHNNKFEAFIVGGCVRDSLLGAVPNDWDITTSAKPEEIISCFYKYKTINTGLKHGTVTVILNSMQIEITTYRIDGKYSDNRRPDEVTFTQDISYDLKRRDFTINSLAYNKEGLVDLFGGIDDIHNKVVKCVGEPDERFNEDNLRILRALRFASVLNFSIHEKTSKSIHENKNLLKNISVERISNEFNKLVLGNFHAVMLEYRDVIQVFLPGVKEMSGEEWLDTLNSMLHVDDLKLKLSLLLSKTESAERALKDLKYDGATIKAVRSLVTYKDENIVDNKIIIKKQLSKMGYEVFVDLLKFKLAAYSSKPHKYEKEIINIRCAKKVLNNVIDDNECYNLKLLAINGEDLLRDGFKKGTYLGSVLNEILELVIEEKLKNNKDELMRFAKKYKNKG